MFHFGEAVFEGSEVITCYDSCVQLQILLDRSLRLYTVYSNLSILHSIRVAISDKLFPAVMSEGIVPLGTSEI